MMKKKKVKKNKKTMKKTYKMMKIKSRWLSYKQISTNFMGEKATL